MKWKEHKKQLLKDPEFRKGYETLEPEYRLATDLIRLRLAKRLNTRQESITRLESANALPSLSTVKKVASALDADLEINLKPRKRARKKDNLVTQPSK